MPAPRIVRFWRASGRVYPEAGPRGIIRRLRYVARARAVAPSLLGILDAPADSALSRHVAQRPQILGFVEAPFLNAGWDADTRLKAFRRQFDYLQEMGPAFTFEVTESIELPPIAALGEEYLIILDKPAWFQREGLLTLNIFRDNLRLFSLNFSFDEVRGKRAVVIGAVQGRRIDGALDEYRQLTRLAHGIRPRDLLIDILRMIAAAVGAERMIAVSDACRHHRHPFFGKPIGRELPLDYDAIWKDRGGVEIDGGFFELPLERQVRALETIPPKKRAMYRLRYAMLDEVEKHIRDVLPTLRAVIRPEAD